MTSSELCQKAHRDLLRRRMKNFSDAGFVVPEPEGIIDQDRWSSENLRQLAHSVWALSSKPFAALFSKSPQCIDSGDPSAIPKTWRSEGKPALNPQNK